MLASGSGSNLQVLIDQLHEDKATDINISVVISDRKQAYALTRAKNAGIPTQIVRTKDYVNRDEFDAEIARQIEKYSAELIVLAGFMKLFQPVFVQKYQNRIINIHPSLLPAFPGATAVADSLEKGVKVTGVTVHYVDEGVDTGPIIAQTSIPVYDTDDEESLHKRIQIEEHKLFPEIIKSHANGNLTVIGRKVITVSSEIEQ